MEVFRRSHLPVVLEREKDQRTSSSKFISLVREGATKQTTKQITACYIPDLGMHITFP